MDMTDAKRALGEALGAAEYEYAEATTAAWRAYDEAILGGVHGSNHS